VKKGSVELFVVNLNTRFPTSNGRRTSLNDGDDDEIMMGEGKKQ